MLLESVEPLFQSFILFVHLNRSECRFFQPVYGGDEMSYEK